MVYLCFSSKDAREPLQEVLCCTEKLEIPVVFDSERLSADEDYNLKGFKSGIDKAEYAIILFTQSSVSSTYVQEEIQEIYKRHQDKSMMIFPILYGMKPDELPHKWQNFMKMIYYEAYDKSDINRICNHIISHILTRELIKYPFRELQTFILQNQNVPLMSYPVNLLNAYSMVDDENPKIKVSFLYALYVYIKNSYNINAIPKFYYAGIYKLFDVARLQIPVNAGEVIILERLILLLLNAVLFGYLC